ncbi:zinc transport system ATP-binding protein [Laceyella sediminis]|uniref:Zinc transport system ATP-binding protein n=2 Tax=Laceyella TaxID=292635 RepID=A0AA45WRU6_9BACL|nr:MULTISPECIES: metal ABC transporter ATP-binding protein [Laceyella]PRZ16654.1 zinc transport system ATP-binding protein [Laceyella sediminis]SMP32968.1 zinc transport system ATP-binding protein [Laceyella tengchongensis]
MKEHVIEIKNLHFSYEEQPVLDGINLVLDRGQFLGLVGPNGSGKSTLIKCVLGMLKPERGEIRLFGQPVRHARLGGRIGYVSQKANSFNLGFPATVKEVVASGLYGQLGLLRRMGRLEWKKVDQAIAKVGLSAFRDRNIGKLSGGQQQRAFIARALVADPDLLILDEPTVGVDAKSTEQFYALLTELHRHHGLTLLLVTHDIGVLSTSVDQVACLNKRLFFHGDPDEFAQREQEILTQAYGHDIQIVSHHHH